MAVILDGSAGITTTTGAVYNSLQSTTAQASTSGTSIDFTTIPSWAKRVTVMFNGISTNGTSVIQVQIGSTSFTVSGYSAVSWDGTAALNTTGFPLTRGASVAAASQSGTLVLTNVSSNIWAATSILGRTDVAGMTVGSGSITLAGVLDRVRITTVNGTDAFDAGSINIIYE